LRGEIELIQAIGSVTWAGGNFPASDYLCDSGKGSSLGKTSHPHFPLVSKAGFHETGASP